MRQVHVAVIGAGLVGLAVARKILELGPKDLRVAVFEKEPEAARHQSGRNSGVIHAGLYYRPGSLKSRLCREGREELLSYCKAEGLPHEICGKLIVLCEGEDEARLRALEHRARQNGVHVRAVGEAELKEIEPAVAATRGLFVPSTAIVDFRAVAARWVEGLREAGAELFFGAAAGVMGHEAEGWILASDRAELRAKLIVNCGGLFADRIARSAGAHPGLRIVPFRGQYFDLRPEAFGLCRNLIYPVPDPSFPFLGVHLSRKIDGTRRAGPNAVLALAREGYEPGQWSLRDAVDTLAFRGFFRFARAHARLGLKEMMMAWSPRAFLRALRRLVPAVEPKDLVSAPSGVRAQAMDSAGHLVDDFHIHETPGALHVLNVPSPAATASLAIGRHIAERALARLA